MNDSVRRTIKIALIAWGMLSDVEGLLTDRLQASRLGQSSCSELSAVMPACAGPWQHAEGIQAPKKQGTQGRRT